MKKLLIHPDLMDAIRAGSFVDPKWGDVQPLNGMPFTITENAVRIELEIIQCDRFCEYDEKDIAWAKPLGLVKVIRHRIPAILIINNFPQFRYHLELPQSPRGGSDNMNKVDELKDHLRRLGWRQDGKRRWRHKSLGARSFTLMGAAVASHLRHEGEGPTHQKVYPPRVYTEKERVRFLARRKAMQRLTKRGKR